MQLSLLRPLWRRYAYLQFILDFWDNLPHVVIFTQDDCLKRGCGWGAQLPSLPYRLMHWQEEWGAGKSISRSNCLCKYMRENTYKRRGYFWYSWMSLMQENLFSEHMANRSVHVVWPQDAAFGVSAFNIRRQPRWLYEVVQRVLTVEGGCGGGGTIMWAHAMERLWFELFDATLTKSIPETSTVLQKQGRRGPVAPPGACFLGAR